VASLPGGKAVEINSFNLVEDSSGCSHEFLSGPQRRIDDKLVGYCDDCRCEVAVQLDKADERTGKSWRIEYHARPAH
jgi:hypothetical protein